MFKFKISITFFCVLMLALTFSSCKKWMDLQPQDGIITDNFWKTKEQVKAAVLGCYASLLDDPSGSKDAAGIKERALAEVFFTWGELRADMLSPSVGATADDYSVISVNTLPSNSIVNWRPVYRTINYCNTLIKYAPQVMENDKTLTQEALDGYVAEARSLRALMYFYLVRSFGEVPLKLEPTASDLDIVNVAKSSQQIVLDQILKDLNESEAKISLSYGDAASDKGRITRYTINAIQADVYLWMDKYNEAITACDKIINSKKFGLIAPGGAWFNTLYRKGNSAESIFEFQFNLQKTNPFYPFSLASKRFVAANQVMDQVFTADPNGILADIRGEGGSVRSRDGLIWKYIASNSTDLVGSADCYTHWFVYRYAEILLMKAEALAQLNKGAEALVYVKMIRDRATALAATDNNPSPTNSKDVSLFILQERAREFMFEGKRWYDVLRYAKRNNYENITYLQDMLSLTVPAASVRSAQAKMLDHNSHYFPIYEYEIQTNKTLVQNPFYQ